VNNRINRLDHPQRKVLNDEAHARPSEALPTSCAVSYFARLSDRANPEREFELLQEFCREYELTAPQPGVKHYAADTGQFRVRWERHTEFARYAITVDDPLTEPFAEPPIRLVSPDWLDQVEGSLLVAVHTRITEHHDQELDLRAISKEYFEGEIMVGSKIADGAAVALTDFRIRKDGFSHLLVLNDCMNPTQTGRMVQRLLEIESYRMMTLLALPLAQSLGPRLTDMEREFSDISTTLASKGNEGDQQLLDRIIQLEAESESTRMNSQFRFSAAEAYYELVQQRTAELRESRIRGLQTFEEFTQRRLTPAVKTCRSTATRQHSLSDRMARATQLLSTRVDVDRQRQNQILLSKMNQRAKTQLRLQATVEGLSVAAITYYVVGLVGYIGKGLQDVGLPVQPTVVTGLSVPLIALLIFLAVRRVRRGLSRNKDT